MKYNYRAFKTMYLTSMTANVPFGSPKKVHKSGNKNDSRWHLMAENFHHVDEKHS